MVGGERIHSQELCYVAMYLCDSAHFVTDNFLDL